MPKWSFTVRGESARADRYVADQLPHLGRKGAVRLCDSGAVQRNGKRLKKSDILSAGDVIDVEDELPKLRAEWDARIEILLETEHLIVANKPPGMPSAGLRHSTEGTLAGALVARYPELQDIGFNALEPGIIHRLDTETSGVLLAARSVVAFQKLRSALEEGRLEKGYLAITTSAPPALEGTIETGLAPEGGSGKRVIASDRDRERRTHYRLLASGRNLFLVEAEVSAAYRHQIRVHLAHVGCPLLGDVFYGGEAWVTGSARHALHASWIRLAQTTGTGFDNLGFSVRAPVPEDFLAVLGEDGFDEALLKRLSSR